MKSKMPGRGSTDSRSFSDLPDFARLPFRPAEDAAYRDSGPPEVATNPFFAAIPAPRSPDEVYALFRAGNPTFDPNVRRLGAERRREHIDDVDTVIFPLRRHVWLEEVLMTTIRTSYRNRPWRDHFIEREVQQVEHAISDGLHSGSLSSGAVGAASFLGDIGLGKTQATMRIAMACPQVIRHSLFRGKRIGVLQIAWLFLSMPPKASVYALLAWIASTIDFLIGTTYRADVDRARNDSARTRIVARALTIHVVGAVFLDELQNIEAGSDLERKNVENTLQELINYTSTRFVFVGTRRARDAIRSEALLRRMIGERGQVRWSAIAEGDEWGEFLRQLWAWQATKNVTGLTPELVTMMHRLTGGVPDYAKRLFTTAQANIIGNSNYQDEKISEDVLIITMKESFPDLHRQLEGVYRRKRMREEREKKRLAGLRKPPAVPSAVSQDGNRSVSPAGDNGSPHVSGKSPTPSDGAKSDGHNQPPDPRRFDPATLLQ